jgi:hypothetical protein
LCNFYLVVNSITQNYCQGGEQNEYEYGADMDEAAIENDFLKALSAIRNDLNNE